MLRSLFLDILGGDGGAPPERQHARAEREPWQRGSAEQPPVGQEERPRGQGEATVKSVHRLPLETFYSDSELAKLPAPDLKRILRDARASRRRRPEGGASGMERADIVKEIRDLMGSSGAQCAVCLSAYEPRDVLRVLPCSHRFHVECVDGWLLTRSSACPMCSERVK